MACTSFSKSAKRLPLAFYRDMFYLDSKWGIEGLIQVADNRSGVERIEESTVPGDI